MREQSPRVPESHNDPFELLAVNLEGFIGRFTPSGWVEPIAKAAGIPNISGDDARYLAAGFSSGELERVLESNAKYRAPYHKEAIVSYFRAGHHKQFVQ